ncbi:MAG: FkbM family methyltransferase [Caulobacteraceae bacterium]|nr:FkbM family methyltransferase [Caulobacteraceae bacterium]
MGKSLKQSLAEFRARWREARSFGVSLRDLNRTRRPSEAPILLKTRFGEFHVRGGDTDVAVIKQVFVNREYDFSRLPQSKDLQKAYEDILSAGLRPLILDAGANNGASALWFAGQFPRARVVAIEPDPSNAELARVNTRRAGNVDVLEAAIGAQEGRVRLIDNAHKEAWGKKTERADDGVPVVTVPSVLANYPDGRLFIVKIDIEGFERDLFSANTDWVDAAAAIFIEPHDWMTLTRRSSATLQKVMFSKDREILILGENLMFV